MVETDIVPRIGDAIMWALEKPSHLLVTVFGAVFLFHLIPFLTNATVRKYPGPLLAKFTDFWLLRKAMAGHRFQTVHEQHKKYGE